jgi:hypothetical protein
MHHVVHVISYLKPTKTKISNDGKDDLNSCQGDCRRSNRVIVGANLIKRLIKRDTWFYLYIVLYESACVFVYFPTFAVVQHSPEDDL